MADAIKEGDYVVAKTESVLRVIQVWKDRSLFLGKRKIRIGCSIGQPYGSLFDIKDNGVLIVQKSDISSNLSMPINDDSEVKDNRSLIASNSSQKLTTSDIEAFKAEGVPGEEIVKIIVENSTSFKEKSLYSQEKYLKKKQLKYVNVMQISKPNSRLLCETFYLYSPQKICNLRIDSLSQMLTFCNVMSGGNYIVVDSVLGLLTASVLERVGTQGIVVQLFMSPSPTTVFKQAVIALNLSADHLENHLYSLDVQKILPLVNARESELPSPYDEDIPSRDSFDSDMSEEQDRNISNYSGNKKQASKLLKQLTFTKAKQLLERKNMDALLIAIKHHPSCVLSLLDFLSYSRPFAVYSMYQEPLVNCYSLLKSRGDIILLNISETWMRKYQVLPERTHPVYNMSSNSGYLLTGIKVEKK